jgi:hypothetical protein
LKIKKCMCFALFLKLGYLIKMHYCNLLPFWKNQKWENVT